MISKRIEVNILRCLPLVLLTAAGGIAYFLSSMKEPPPENTTQLEAPLVETSQVKQCEDGFFIEVDGEVIPHREIRIAALVPGRVKSKSDSARAGEFVKTGELLIEIDPRDFELAIKQNQEAVKQTGVSIEEADIEISSTASLISLAERELELNRNEVKRYQELATQNAGSKSQLDAALRAELQSQNALQTLKNKLSLTEAKRNRLIRQKEEALIRLEKAVLDLSRTKVKSPVDGVVMEDHVEVDDYVQPGAALVTLEDTSKTEIRFDLRLDQMRWIWDQADEIFTSETATYDLPPLKIDVFLGIDGYRYRWTAKLARYDGAGINPKTRTVPCIAVVENPELVDEVRDSSNLNVDFPPPTRLMRGSFVSLRIPVQTRLDLVEIPTNSLRPGNRVWIVENSKLVIRDVAVAYAGKERAVLLAGAGEVQAGDRVITSPMPILVDGMEVRDERAETLTSSETKPEAY